MILDTGDLKLITPSNEDSGLLVFSNETRMFLYKKVIEEILKEPSKFPSNFMSKKRVNKDKFMFTLSVFGACFYDGIRSDTLIKINQAIEIYDEWMTSIPRNKIITTEFLKIMINQLTLPFSFSNELNIPERVGVLLKISHLLNKISSGESKHLYTETKQINQELLIHLLKIHFTILYKIMKSSLVNDHQCISLLSETLFCLLLVCEPSQEVKELYKLFPTLFTYWISFYEFRKVFIQFILVIQKNYLLHYNTLPIIPITPPLISEYPFGTLFIKEKHLRLLWIALIPCLNVSSLTPINLLEITKAIGDLLDDAITSNISIIILNKIYGNLFFSLIQQYNDVSYQEAINFCVIKTLYLYETYIKDIIKSPTLLAKLMIFIRYCLKSKQLNIVISTLSSFDLLLDAHIPEFILLYKDIVCSMLQLTSFYDLTKDKSILKVVITTLSSLSYYFPLLSEYALLQSNNINIDDIIKTQIIVLTETNKVGIFPKGYYEKYLNSISNFISVFARLKYYEELDGIIDFNKAINESQKINNEQQIHLFFKTERSYKRKCLTEYQGNLINNPISILWKGTIFNDNDKRDVCTLKDLSILQQLQCIKSSFIRNRIYCRVVEKEFSQYIQKNEDLRIEEPILQVIMKKRKNNQWIGKRRRNICEFLYSINTQESTEQIKNDVVIFVDDDIPEQTQIEEYVVGIKVIDWNMREIKIKCIDKIEFIGYRNKQEIIGTIEGEIMRLIQRDYPNKMIQEYSDDILQRINITPSNPDQWICNDVIGTYLSRKTLNNFIILWNNKNYVSFKDLSQNSIAKEEEEKVMKNDDDKIENNNIQIDVNIKRHSIILENTH
ncbi:hypothetical protein CL6EHI_004500 [Entamoeba histolytica]|uniref:Uncharacterized protein n=1 Tax=Entamoeba histolytica TaxID=5759 RepID=A0A175JJV0_ENTHI|nr:hypothetical protein CL6EHI_004500 [Entamoeba histolytica]